MNTITTIRPLVFLIILCSCVSCRLFQNDDEPKSELEKLPPITQNGENTFGCLVNGKAFVVTNTSKQVAIFQQGQLQFGASFDEGVLDESVYMILGDPLIENETYDFTEIGHNAEYQNRNNGLICLYTFEETFEGLIVFSNIDLTNFVISGTFEFSTFTEGCDTVRITDGRFDMQYIP